MAVRKKIHKVILLGEVGVGKTSLYHRIKSDTFHDCPPTLTSDYLSEKFKIGGKEITIQLWDTAGVERFDSMTRNYYRGTSAVVYVYSVDSMLSFVKVKKLENDVSDEQLPNQKVLRFVVGNKIDLDQDKHEVTDEEVANFCQYHDCFHAFRTSAKTGVGVKATLKTIAKHIAEVPDDEWHQKEAVTLNPVKMQTSTKRKSRLSRC